MKIEIDKKITDLLYEVVKRNPNIERPSKVAKRDFIRIIPNTSVNIIHGGELEYTTKVGSLQDFEVSECVKILGATECTNSLLYHPMSMMRWHTNSDNPGKRIYYTYTEGEAIFRYINESGENVIDEDNVGWTARIFTIPTEGLLWHSVWTEKPRYSFGFNIKQ